MFELVDIAPCVQQAPIWTCQAGDGGLGGRTWSSDTGADRHRTRASVRVACSRSVRQAMLMREAGTRVTVMLAWQASTCLMTDTSPRKIDSPSLSCTLATPAWLVTTNGENTCSDHCAAWETVSRNSVVILCTCKIHSDKGKGKGPVLDIALLHDEHMLRSTSQSQKWQPIGLS